MKPRHHVVGGMAFLDYSNRLKFCMVKVPLPPKPSALRLSDAATNKAQPRRSSPVRTPSRSTIHAFVYTILPTCFNELYTAHLFRNIEATIEKKWQHIVGVLKAENTTMRLCRHRGRSMHGCSEPITRNMNWRMVPIDGKTSVITRFDARLPRTAKMAANLRAGGVHIFKPGHQ